MNSEGKQRTSKRADGQIDHLIKFMSEHRDFASGRFQGPDGKRSQDAQWEALTKELNELGTSKTVDQWKKMWRNDKSCARKKNSDLKKYLGQTGNKTTKHLELSEREKLIISIIGKETSEGIGVGEAGFGQATFNPNLDDYQIEIIEPEDNSELQTAIEVIEVEDLCETTNFNTLVDDVIVEKRSIENDLLQSSPLYKIPRLTTVTSGLKPQMKNKGSKIEKYKDLVIETNDGLKDITLAINNSSKVLDTMAKAFTEMGQQFKRMNDIAERCLLEKKK